MREIHRRDLAESRRTDIRAKFDSTYIPNVHRAEQELPPGMHGWYDSDGELHLFVEPAEIEEPVTELEEVEECA